MGRLQDGRKLVKVKSISVVPSDMYWGRLSTTMPAVLVFSYNVVCY